MIKPVNTKPDLADTGPIIVKNVLPSQRTDLDAGNHKSIVSSAKRINVTPITHCSLLMSAFPEPCLPSRFDSARRAGRLSEGGFPIMISYSFPTHLDRSIILR